MQGGKSGRNRRKQRLSYSGQSPYAGNGFFKRSDRDLGIYFISDAQLRLIMKSKFRAEKLFIAKHYYHC